MMSNERRAISIAALVLVSSQAAQAANIQDCDMNDGGFLANNSVQLFRAGTTTAESVYGKQSASTNTRGPTTTPYVMANGALIFQTQREAGVFRQETIARMHRLRAGDLAGRDDRRLVQIALPRRSRPNTDRLVGHAYMHRIGIGGGMHRD